MVFGRVSGVLQMKGLEAKSAAQRNGQDPDGFHKIPLEVDVVL